MADYQSQYTGAQIDSALANTVDLVASIKLALYPVGSIYMSVVNTDPSTFIGGTWVQIQDTFLLAAGNTYSAGNSGGSTEHTHDISHTHTMAHTHTYAHTHTTPATTTGSHTLTTAEIPAHTHGSKTLIGTMNPLAWASSASESGIISGSQNHTDRVGNAGSNWGDRKYTINATHEHSSVGGGGGHTHSQVATTTNSQSATVTSAASNATTSAASNETSGIGSNMPPYLAVYMWKRTA